MGPDFVKLVLGSVSARKRPVNLRYLPTIVRIIINNIKQVYIINLGCFCAQNFRKNLKEGCGF